MSHKENLDLLAAELKIPLELVEKEKSIGEFSADMVAKIPNPDSESEELVVIEMETQMIWMELPDKKASRIKVEKAIEVTDKNQWQTAFEFLKEEGEKIQHIFPKYLKELE